MSVKPVFDPSHVEHCARTSLTVASVGELRGAADAPPRWNPNRIHDWRRRGHPHHAFLPAPVQLSFIRDIRRHVNDPDAAVFRCERIAWVLEPAFAIADCHQIRGRNLILCHEEALDRIRPSLR
jgi:hypothetical protein